MAPAAFPRWLQGTPGPAGRGEQGPSPVLEAQVLLALSCSSQPLDEDAELCPWSSASPRAVLGWLEESFPHGALQDGARQEMKEL